MTAEKHEGLVPTEGVDEGSAASATEDERTGAGDAQGSAPAGRAAQEEDPAGPQDVETADVTAGRKRAPGQELAEGEG